MKSILIGGAIAVISLSLAAATDVTVTQKDKKFSVARLQAKVGDTVSFRNDDPYFHNIFSLSDTQSFDLGSYPQGQSRKVVLQKEGTVEVECAIHPDMKMVIEVRK
jgi:plastocyanin